MAVFLLGKGFEGSKGWFMAYPTMDVGGKAYLGMFSHILGHANWQHLMGNFMLILLIGPILEERWGSISLLFMILVTALVTGLINVAFASQGLVGASGVVFMMILLASMANIRAGEIPLTFIVIALVYLGGEVVAAVKGGDNISHMAHLIGGATGALFGFIGAKPKAGADARPIGLVGAKKPLAIDKIDLDKL
ncbi:MAG: rhomboid family intramembrane serine protease [Proteobacteria bacterium]|nr:rhomboid family intramembrane serine protease [Pseudomonadota bacterium]